MNKESTKESTDDHELFSFEELGLAFAKALDGQPLVIPEPEENSEGQDILSDKDFSEENGAEQEIYPDTDSVILPKNTVSEYETDFFENTDIQNTGMDASAFPDAVENDGIVPVTPLTVLEAMLFMGDSQNRPLLPSVAAGLMRGVTEEEIHSMVGELNTKYDTQRAPWTIRSQDDGYVMLLREEFLPIREVFYGKIRQAKLSQAAIDILAIIAYKQPLTAEDITQIRGASSVAILGQLTRRHLLQTKKVKRDGKFVTEYSTTSRFLKLFQLESLADLPQSEDLDRK
ncbi:MAG: SMC-Scp complex subunit ScpB [Planctomycetia bacterium]|nr:SMC-Scp complex subunit ScpB [Planctomycetia bacterium]